MGFVEQYSGRLDLWTSPMPITKQKNILNSAKTTGFLSEAYCMDLDFPLALEVFDQRIYLFSQRYFVRNTSA